MKIQDLSWKRAKSKKLDYDIDKAYIMGLNFDFNGKYVGWSSLFDYSSEKTIIASEELPMPKQKRYTYSENGIDISKYVDEIIELENSIADIDTESERILRINYYAKLLRLLKNTNEVSYKGTNTDDLQKIIKILNQHESTVIPPNLKEASYKNFIAIHIQRTVQSLENSIKAYSPIEMNVGRNSAKYSSKTQESNNLTLLSPSTKFIMQFQNLSGKRVVGIAANGEKGSFMWHYYMNDVIQHPEKYNIENAKFEFKTTRISGRAKNKIKEQTINMLPGVKITQEFLNEHPDFQLLRITDNLAVDLMISQMVSLATDNAKELILAKINAGDKLAKCHLFLITLGFNVDDIVKFMTSPAVNFIDTITDNNIFDDLMIYENQAIEIAGGDFSSLWDNGVISYLVNENENIQNLENLLKQGIVPEEIKLDSYSKKDLQIIDNVNRVREIKALMNYDPNDENIKADLKEFKNVLEGANEFTSYTQALGLNQGIKTSKSEIQRNLQNLSRAIQARCDENNTTVPLEFKYFDPVKFVNNTEYAEGKFYRDELIKLYNNNKKCINIFDHLDKIPQYKAIMQIYACILQYDRNISIRTKIYDAIYKKIKPQTKANISEPYLNSLVHSIDNNLITGFFSSRNIKVPIPKNSVIFTRNGIRDFATTGDLMELNTIDKIATFKLFMENVVIPSLKEGKYYAYENGNVVEKQNSDLEGNSFISELIKTKDHKIPLYKCDVNMLLINKNSNAQIKIGKYIRGLHELQNINVTDELKLSDLFVLYNLIVNKNKYGSERMTGVIDGLLKEHNSLSTIKDYLQFIGNLDFFGDVEVEDDLIKITSEPTPDKKIYFEVNYKDNLFHSSNTVYSKKGQKDPSIIFIDQDGNSHFLIKEDNSYKETYIFSSNEQSTDDDLERVDNLNKYYTLGGHLKSLNDTTIDILKKLNNESLKVISDLIMKQVLRISKICK